MSRSAASVTLLDLFSVPLTFQIVLGLGKVCVGMLKWFTRSGNMKKAFGCATIYECTDFRMKGFGVEFDECMYGLLVWNECGLRK